MEGGSQKLGLLATAYPRLSNAQNFFLLAKKSQYITPALHSAWLAARRMGCCAPGLQIAL